MGTDWAESLYILNDAAVELGLISADLADPYASVSLEHPKVSETWAPAASTTDAPVVPLDVRPTIIFNHAVRDDSGQGFVTAGDPDRESVGEYDFEYALTGVALGRRRRPARRMGRCSTPGR